MAASKKTTYVWRDPRLVTGVMTVVMGLYALTITTLAGLLVPLLSGSPALSPASRTAALIAIPLTSWAYYLCALTAVFWNLRVSKNAHTFGRRMEYSAWATLYWYIVPFAWFVMPMLVMEDIWLASGAKNTILVKAWWALFVANLLFRVAVQFMPSVVLSEIVNTLTVVSTVTFLVMANKLSALQRKSDVADVFGDAPQASPLLNFS
jgi:hypothetical protein